MPDFDRHLIFDKRLRKNGIIAEDTHGNSIHKRMDKGCRWFAEKHRELDPWHSTLGSRAFVDQLIRSKIIVITQDLATDYVRIALGHQVLDRTASYLKRKYNCTYAELDWGEVYTKAYQNFRRNRYHLTYFRRIPNRKRRRGFS